MYLTNNLESQVALCVYDITSKNSFQVMKNWVNELKANGPAEIRTNKSNQSIGCCWKQTR